MAYAKNDFGVVLNTTLNTSNVPKQIDKLQAELIKSNTTKIKLPVDVDTGKIKFNISTKQLKQGLEEGKLKIKEFFKEINTYKDQFNNTFKDLKILDLQGNIKHEELTQVTSAIKKLTTETHKWVDSKGAIQNWSTTVDQNGKTVSTRVKEVVDDMGNITKTTSKLVSEGAGKPFKKMGQDIVEVSDMIKETTTSTSTSIGKITDTVNGVTKTFNGTITTIKKVSSNGEELTTEISRYTNEMGQAVEKTETFNKVGTKVATTMRKISDVSKGNVETGTTTLIDANGNKTIYQYADGVATLRTEVNQYKTALGGLVTVTSTYNEQTGELISKNREVTTDLQKQAQEAQKLAQYKKELVTTTLEEEKTITRNGQQYKAVVKTIEEETAEYGKLTTTITTYKDNLGRINVETKKVNEKGQEVAQTTKTITKELDKASNSVNKYGESTKKAAVETKSFGQQLSDAITRLARYYIASIPIQAFRKGITEAIQTVKDFDNALIEFRKVSDLAGESLTNYVAKLAEMGKITGSTMQAMVEASTEFRKSGFSDKDSATLASVAEMYRNVADEEISAADSASFIIAQMKAFNIEAEDSMHIIDAVNEVANHFAVSSADLAGNLGKVSASLSVNGTKFEQVLGMMTAVTEVTRNASTASRGLSMISSRLVQVLDDSSSTGKKLRKIYHDLNIELEDENGQMRGTYDILKDLAKRWNTLTSDQQKYIALTSAGARQTQNFVALMKNFDQAIKATEMAYDSAGSAAKENEKVMDSITKKTEILRTEFQKLVIDDGKLQNLAKTFLDIATSIIKVVEAFGGLPTILKLVTALFISLNSVKIATWFSNVVGGIKNLVYALPNAISAWKAYKEGIVSANTAMQASTPIIGLLVAAIGLISTAISNYNKEIEEQKQKTRESILQYINESKNLDKIIDQVKNETLSREELNSIIENNLGIYDAEYLKLLDINEAREKTIKLLEEEEKKRRQELIETGQIEYEEALERQQHGIGNWEKITRWGDFFSDFLKIATFQKTGSSPESRKNRIMSESGAQTQDYDGWIVPVGSIDEQIKKLEEYRSQLITERENLDTSSKEYEEYQQKIQDTIDLIGELKSQRDTDTATIKAYNQALADEGKYYDQNTKQVKELSEEGKRRAQLAKEQENIDKTYENEIQQLEELAEQYGVTNEEVAKYIEEHEGTSWEDAVSYLVDEKIAAEEDANALKEMANALGISEEALLANADAMGLSVEVYYEHAMAVKANDEALDSLQSAYQTLQSAVEEYNETQVLSLDTVQALLNLKPEYLSALIEENGQLSINEEAIMNSVKALIEERKQQILSIAYDRISAIERGEVAGAADAEAGSVSGNAAELDNESKSLSKNTVQQYANAVARQSAQKKLMVDEVMKEVEREFKAIEKLGNSLVSLGGAGASSGKKRAGGSKEATDALKEENKAVSDLKSKYDKVITFITGRIDKQIKAVQKAKDEAVKAVEEEIKAREKQKDKALDAIEQQINALEKEKKAREKYWDDQIDALKKANDERKDALELQEKLDALEKAKNTKVKVYKEGQGFVYDVDQTAVAEAQKALDEYLSEKAYEEELERLNALKDAEINNYDKRLEALNEYKDKVQESYEKQIEALNAHKEALEEQYDAQIEYYQNFKEQFEEMVKAYEDKQTELLASQLTGINFENNNWMTRLDNLAKFVSEYNRLQEQLNTGNTNVTNTASMSGGGGGGLSKGTTNTTTNTTPTINGNNLTPAQREQLSRQGNKVVVDTGNAEYRARVLHIKTGHADGISSVKDNEIAVVGENPNKEIVVGSKINNGQLMSLGKGTGVVNAKSSNTLAGLLNQVGQFGSSGFGSGNGTLNSNINNDSLTINGVTIQGANINDPQTFVNGLLNLKAEALQRAYRHR